MSEENFFEIAKVLHIVSVISWMAGMLYLPRIFAYHAANQQTKEITKVFKVMERRLLFYIMTPAMIVAISFGGILVYYLGFDFRWLHIKITLVILLVCYHIFMFSCYKKFAADKNTRSARFYKIINEIPTLLMIGIVTLVILKPF